MHTLWGIQDTSMYITPDTMTQLRANMNVIAARISLHLIILDGVMGLLNHIWINIYANIVYYNKKIKEKIGIEI